MANNFGYGNNRNPLTTDNLHKGDVLIRADWSRNRWVENEWTVKAVLKTRVILTRTRQDGTEIELRMLVHASKSYDTWNGRLQTQYQGQSEWSRDSMYLFTPDDEELIRLRNQHAAEAARSSAKSAAYHAAREFTNYRSVEAAKAAIEALQAFIDISEGE